MTYKKLSFALIAGTIILLSSLQAKAQPAYDTFTDICKKGAQSQNIAIAGKEGWYFLKSELRSLSVGDFWGKNASKTSRVSNPKLQDPLAAISAYDKTLKKENIHLLIVPIPPKAIIYPDKLPGSNLPMARYDKSLQKFYTLLRQQGIDVIDVTPQLINAHKSNTEPVYCKGDSHYSGYGCKIVADAIAKRLKEIGISGKQKYSISPKKQTMQGDLYKAANKNNPQKENITVYMVEGNNLKNKNSPILLLGDSHTLVFDVGSDMFASNAGLPSLLAAETGMSVDVMGVRGSGATPARINVYRRSKSDKSFLKKKKVFVWCFSAREFTEASGWNAQVPVK